MISLLGSVQTINESISLHRVLFPKTLWNTEKLRLWTQVTGYRHQDCRNRGPQSKGLLTADIQSHGSGVQRVRTQGVGGLVTPGGSGKIHPNLPSILCSSWGSHLLAFACGSTAHLSGPRL